MILQFLQLVPDMMSFVEWNLLHICKSPIFSSKKRSTCDLEVPASQQMNSHSLKHQYWELINSNGFYYPEITADEATRDEVFCQDQSWSPVAG